MTHYICTGGCGGRSDEKGICQAPQCADFKGDLKPCECTDEKHAEVLGASEGEAMDSEEKAA